MYDDWQKILEAVAGFVLFCIIFLGIANIVLVFILAVYDEIYRLVLRDDSDRLTKIV